MKPEVKCQGHGQLISACLCAFKNDTKVQIQSSIHRLPVPSIIFGTISRSRGQRWRSRDVIMPRHIITITGQTWL